ncbi:MAG TPA: hypothetical protein VK498_15640 [Ferruginibacter sp.]|nr:hypothetical protein [Ferruginibacter sp.]
MKKILAILLSFTIITVGFAQGKSNGKGKNKKDKANKHANKSDERYENNDNTGIYDRRNDNVNNQGKSSKNQPSKVRAAFQRDYPNATNVAWTKNQGYWTATFNNGGIFNTYTTATYHANGQRRDANSTAQNGQAQGTVLDRILKRNPVN